MFLQFRRIHLVFYTSRPRLSEPRVRFRRSAEKAGDRPGLIRCFFPIRPRLMLGLENSGPSRPAPREGSGAKGPKTSIGTITHSPCSRCSCADTSQSDIGGTLANRVP